MNFLRVVDIMEALSMIAVFSQRNYDEDETARLPGFVVDELAIGALESSPWQI